jgi:hypothetical protein
VRRQLAYPASPALSPFCRLPPTPFELRPPHGQGFEESGHADSGPSLAGGWGLGKDFAAPGPTKENGRARSG